MAAESAPAKKGRSAIARTSVRSTAAGRIGRNGANATKNASKNTNEAARDQNQKMAATSVPESESKKFRVKAETAKK
jgi:hypothetical protein